MQSDGFSCLYWIFRILVLLFAEYWIKQYNKALRLHPVASCPNPTTPQNATFRCGHRSRDVEWCGAFRRQLGSFANSCGEPGEQFDWLRTMRTWSHTKHQLLAWTGSDSCARPQSVVEKCCEARELTLLAGYKGYAIFIFILFIFIFILFHIHIISYSYIISYHIISYHIIYIYKSA